jgi:hypothetical protein
MDFPPITSWQWLAIAVFLGLAVFLVWKFRLEEVVQYPLANEEDCGVWKVPLPGMGREVQVGRVTTARNHFTALYSRDVTAAKGDERDKKLAMRDEILNTKFLFAQRAGRGKIIYICDANPQDPAFHVREDTRGNVQVSWIPVQDCLSAGVGVDGFEYISLKLKTTKGSVTTFTSEQREHEIVLAEALKYEKLSAHNTEQIKSKDEQISMLTEMSQKYLATINMIMAQKGVSDLIAGMKDMVTGETPAPLPSSRVPGIKEFFTWAQVGVSLISFVAVPYIMRAANIGPPAEPTVAALVVAFMAWVATPFIRKLIGK